MPGTPKIVPTDTIGLDGGRITRSAARIASMHSGGRRALLQADEQHTLRRDLGPQTDPVLLEVHDPLPARCVGVGDDDVRLDPVVGHRQQPDTRPPAPAQGLGHGREGIAGLQHLGADQVGREVTVAQPEPGRLDAVRRQLLLGVPRLVAATPPALGVDAVAQGVHDRVEIGADLEAVQPDVVGGVRDDGDGPVVGAVGGQEPGLDGTLEPLEEPRSAHPAGQYGDRSRRRLHGPTVPDRSRARGSGGPYIRSGLDFRV